MWGHLAQRVRLEGVGANHSPSKMRSRWTAIHASEEELRDGEPVSVCSCGRTGLHQLSTPRPLPCCRYKAGRCRAPAWYRFEAVPRFAPSLTTVMRRPHLGPTRRLFDASGDQVAPPHDLVPPPPASRRGRSKRPVWQNGEADSTNTIQARTSTGPNGYGSARDQERTALRVHLYAMHDVVRYRPTLDYDPTRLARIQSELDRWLGFDVELAVQVQAEWRGKRSRHWSGLTRTDAMRVVDPDRVGA
jgi:hypothetical protein